MTHPSVFGVRSLIFDMDGTLISSHKVSEDAVRSALGDFFSKRNRTAPAFSREDLLKGIGAPTHEFYADLLPDEFKADWKELRATILEYEREGLKKKRITFPGAIHVLTTLRKRGYKLALVSNCSRHYMDEILDTQGLRDRFDITACISDQEGATKASLTQDILSQFGGKGANIGDRYYDVDAAKECGIPSIGVLYGYGNREELAGTATWVEDVRDLLHVFNPLREQAEEFAGRCNKARKIDQPMLVALETPSSAVTRPFTEYFLQALLEMNVTASWVRLEDHLDFSSGVMSLDSLYDGSDWSSQIESAKGKERFSLELKSRTRNIPGRVVHGRPGQIVLIEGPLVAANGRDELFGAVLSISPDKRLFKKKMNTVQTGSNSDSYCMPMNLLNEYSLYLAELNPRSTDVLTINSTLLW